jgi:hypothetical protein
MIFLQTLDVAANGVLGHGASLFERIAFRHQAGKRRARDHESAFFGGLKQYGVIVFRHRLFFDETRVQRRKGLLSLVSWDGLVRPWLPPLLFPGDDLVRPSARSAPQAFPSRLSPSSDFGSVDDMIVIKPSFMPIQFGLTFRSSSAPGRDEAGDLLSGRDRTTEGYDGQSLPTPTFLEFFAGAGLVRQGLLPVWQCVWANDIDPSKERIYTANFGKNEFACGDVADVEVKELPAADMAWASFPCQDLSLAGWQRGMSAGRSGTFWAFWRLMRDLFDAGQHPPMIVEKSC